MHKNSKLTSERCVVYINEEEFDFEVKGSFFEGKDELLFNTSDNILSNVSWQNSGFSILKLFTEASFLDLQNSITTNIIEGLRKANIKINSDNFNLKDYHKYVTNAEDHFAVINHTRNLRNEDLKIDIEALEKLLSKHLKIKLSSIIKDLGRSHIQIRISRPDSLDINPPHRDSYLDYYKNILNIWIPISGCNDKSSLPIVPGSHLINERNIIRTDARSAYVNGNIYAVPCMLKTVDGPFKMIRPNPKETEALIFTPYLVHGAAVNLNSDITRISLELRFDKC